MSSATLLTAAIIPDSHRRLSVGGPTRSVGGGTDGFDHAILAGRARGHSAGRGMLARVAECVIPKSGHRFSEKITHKQKRVIPKSGHRFSEKIMHKQNRVIPKSGHRFSEKIMHNKSRVIPKSGTGFRKRSRTNKKLRDPERWAPND